MGRRTLLLAGTAALIAGATWHATLGSPGPWLGAGPAPGVRATTITGGLVGCWLAGTLVALLRRREGWLLAALALLGLVPLLAGAGYVIDSAALAGRPLTDLLATRAPAAAVVVVLPLILGAAAARTASRRPAARS